MGGTPLLRGVSQASSMHELEIFEEIEGIRTDPWKR